MPSGSGRVIRAPDAGQIAEEDRWIALIDIAHAIVAQDAGDDQGRDDLARHVGVVAQVLERADRDRPYLVVIVNERDGVARVLQQVPSHHGSRRWMPDDLALDRYQQVVERDLLVTGCIDENVDDPNRGNFLQTEVETGARLDFLTHQRERPF